MPRMKATMATEAPGGDLQLWKDLEKYQVFDQQISIAGRKVLEQHSFMVFTRRIGGSGTVLGPRSSGGKGQDCSRIAKGARCSQRPRKSYKNQFSG